jgi:hypothetical protein
MTQATHEIAPARSAPQGRARGGLFAPRVFNPRTRQRFLLDRTRELIRHLGREPSYPERILISRVASCEWDLRRLDHRMDQGEELSAHAMRSRLAMETRLKLDLRELGLRPTSPRTPTLDEHLAAMVARQEAAARAKEEAAA